MNAETKRLLNLDVIIESIKNEIMIDEETAVIICTFDGNPLYVFWAYTTGFSIPVFLAPTEVLKHIENQLINKTVFHGLESEKGYVGLQVLGVDQPKKTEQNAWVTQKI